MALIYARLKMFKIRQFSVFRQKTRPFRNDPKFVCKFRVRALLNEAIFVQFFSIFPVLPRIENGYSEQNWTKGYENTVRRVVLVRLVHFGYSLFSSLLLLRFLFFSKTSKREKKKDKKNKHSRLEHASTGYNTRGDGDVRTAPFIFSAIAALVTPRRVSLDG